MNIKFDDLDVLVKFISNRVDYSTFEKYMLERYSDVNYISPLWTSFRDNPLMFIVGRSEVFLLDAILKDIENRNYKG